MDLVDIKKGLADIFEGKRIINLKEHRHVINPLTDHESFATHEMLSTAIETYKLIGDFSGITKLLGEEDRGGFLTALTAYNMKLPFGLVKWNPIEYSGQISVDFRNAYTTGKMYLNGAIAGDRVMIVEDLIDTGGTVIALIDLLKKADIEVLQVVALAAKEENHGVDKIYEATGIRASVGCYFSLEGDISRITRFNF